MKLNTNDNQLVTELIFLIEDGKKQLAFAVNAALTSTYWRVGKRINSDILNNKRADYGKQIILTISRRLVIEYGNNFEEKNLRRMMQFAQVFDNESIVVSLIRQSAIPYLENIDHRFD